MAITAHRDMSTPMRHGVSIGSQRIVVDGTLDEGGEGAGVSPHDLYDASLAACVALTVVWYAKRHGIPVGSIEAAVERDASQERTGARYGLEVRLWVGGEISEAQRADLLRVADHCPIHRLMTGVATEITTRWATSAAPEASD